MLISSSEPLQEEPYEQETVLVAPSTIPFAGEGLFAKRKLEKGAMI